MSTISFSPAGKTCRNARWPLSVVCSTNLLSPSSGFFVINDLLIGVGELGQIKISCHVSRRAIEKSCLWPAQHGSRLIIRGPLHPQGLTSAWVWVQGTSLTSDLCNRSLEGTQLRNFHALINGETYLASNKLMRSMTAAKPPQGSKHKPPTSSAVMKEIESFTRQFLPNQSRAVMQGLVWSGVFLSLSLLLEINTKAFLRTNKAANYEQHFHALFESLLLPTHISSRLMKSQSHPLCLELCDYTSANW